MMRVVGTYLDLAVDEDGPGELSSATAGSVRDLPASDKDTELAPSPNPSRRRSCASRTWMMVWMSA